MPQAKQISMVEQAVRGSQTLKELMGVKISSYQEAFTKLMAAIGIRDIQLLVTAFIQGEEKNFAMFKFVNELNNEIENYETQILEMQSEIDKNLAEGGQDSQKRRAIKELEKKLNKTRKEITEMEDLSRGNMDKVDKIKACIWKIAQVVECDTNQELIGN